MKTEPGVAFRAAGEHNSCLSDQITPTANEIWKTNSQISSVYCLRRSTLLVLWAPTCFPELVKARGLRRRLCRSGWFTSQLQLHRIDLHHASSLCLFQSASLPFIVPLLTFLCHSYSLAFQIICSISRAVFAAAPTCTHPHATSRWLSQALSCIIKAAITAQDCLSTEMPDWRDNYLQNILILTLWYGLKVTFLWAHCNRLGYEKR